MNLSFQDLLAIWGPSLALTGSMWHHFNGRFEKIEEKINSLEERVGADMKRMEEKLGADIRA